jgi:hypothetical protein
MIRAGFGPDISVVSRAVFAKPVEQLMIALHGWSQTTDERSIP